MSLAVVRQCWRDSRLVWLLVLIGILVFEVMFLRAIREFGDDVRAQLLRLPFIRRFIRTLVGADMGDDFTATTLMTIGFVHPVVLTLTWGLLVTHSSRVLAGEVDRGTADMTLSLPISRARYYTGVSFALLLMGLPIFFAPLFGIAIGERIFPLSEPVDLSRLAIISVNFAALFVGIGGLAMMTSAMSDSRGRAIGVVVGVLLASMLVNYLVPFFEEAKLDFIHYAKYVGVLQYYQPLQVLREGRLPLDDVGVLVAMGLGCWAFGLWRFCRRDIPAA